MLKRDFIISIFSLTLGLCLLFKESEPSEQAAHINSQEKVGAQRNLYGVVIDSTQSVIEETILPNQDLLQILSPYNVSFSVIENLIRNSKGLFDFRKLTPHQKYALVFEGSSISRPAVFIYELNDFEVIICQLKGEGKITRQVRKFDSEFKSLAGVVKN